MDQSNDSEKKTAVVGPGLGLRNHETMKMMMDISEAGGAVNSREEEEMFRNFGVEPPMASEPRPQSTSKYKPPINGGRRKKKRKQQKESRKKNRR